jgi:hypothetical protein
MDSWQQVFSCQVSQKGYPTDIEHFKQPVGLRATSTREITVIPNAMNGRRRVQGTLSGKYPGFIKETLGKSE